VKFNAETKREIEFKGQNFEFMKRGKKGYHQLVAELLRGHRLIYPSFVFLDENQKVIQVISKYRGPKEFERIISYFGEDHHKKTPWSVYRKSYKSTLISNE
jgi:thioredoxin-related protein